MKYRIEFRCEKGHKQVMTYSGVTREYADGHAKLIDGTSPMYVYPPGNDSSIGKCATCGSQITSTPAEVIE